MQAATETVGHVCASVPFSVPGNILLRLGEILLCYGVPILYKCHTAFQFKLVLRFKSCEQRMMYTDGCKDGISSKTGACFCESEGQRERKKEQTGCANRLSADQWQFDCNGE